MAVFSVGGETVDGAQFDQLSRRFARLRTRRQALRAIAGAAVGVVAGTRHASAQSCAAHYNPCGGDDQCCAGAVCEYGLCMPGCRIDGVFTSAWMSPPDNICAQCRPELSTTSWTPANEGMSCWSGDPNAGATFCQSGECRATGPANCPPPPPCHTDQLVDATTCTYAVAEAGTLCGGQAMCYGGFYQPADTCDGNGFCIGGGSQTVPCAPYLCGDGACTTSCQLDADCAPGAHCDDGLCFPDADLGQPCDEDGDCRSGMCVEGVCCNDRCPGLCQTCSAETGGVCSSVCEDDGLSCTAAICDEETGACTHTLRSGACLIGGVCYNAGDANQEDPCQFCDPAADQDAWSTRAAGESCGVGMVCSGGACVGNGECATGNSGCNDADGCGGSACMSGFNGCKLTVEGGTTCLGAETCVNPCTSSQDCPTGMACTTSCCGLTCMEICGAAALSTASLRTGAAVSGISPWAR